MLNAMRLLIAAFVGIVFSCTGYPEVFFLAALVVLFRDRDARAA